MSTYLLYGSTGSTDTYFCLHVLKRIIEKSGSKDRLDTRTETMLELDYLKKLKDIKPSYGSEIYGHKALQVIMKDDKYIGGLMDIINIATEEYGIEDAEIVNVLFLEKESREETIKILAKNGHPVATLTFSNSEKQGDEDEPRVLGKIVIELFDDICPIACDNFLKLCSGEKGEVIVDESTGVTAKLHYEGNPVHRVVKGGWIQCGDVVDGSGLNSFAAVEETGKFRDESFSVDFGAEMGGIVGYSTKAPHSNGSLFFITLGSCDWMNNKSVGFGRVVQGFTVLKEIEVAQMKNERPTSPSILITSCGEMRMKLDA